MSQIDLATALTMFKQGAQELKLSRAIGQANEQVSQVRASELDEQKKRAELQNIANSLTANMAQIGAPATTIQQVAGAIGPKQFATPDQAILEGTMTGNTWLASAGMEAEEKAAAPQNKAADKAFSRQVALQDRQFNQQLTLEGLKARAAAGKGSGAKQTPEDVSFEANLTEADSFIKQLRTSITRSGTYESRFGNQDDAATLDANPYKLAIAYAKIVDPASVAREGEVEAAKKYMLELGPTASKGVALRKLAQMEAELKSRLKTRAAIKARGAGATVPEDAAPAADAGFFVPYSK